MCGSTILNKRFEEVVRKAVGEEEFIRLKKTPGWRIGVKEFECSLKIAFRGKEDPDKHVSFPRAGLADNPAAGIEGNSLTLSG